MGLLRKIKDRINNLISGSPPSFDGWHLIVDDTVVGILGAPVHWDGGCWFYSFDPGVIGRVKTSH